jgi:hypothetical protein
VPVANKTDLVLINGKIVTTVLDRDILTIPADDIINTLVDMTIVGGEIVYKNKP